MSIQRRRIYGTISRIGDTEEGIIIEVETDRGDIQTYKITDRDFRSFRKWTGYDDLQQNKPSRQMFDVEDGWIIGWQ